MAGDYMNHKPAPTIDADLALRIIRKAAALAERFEDQAICEMSSKAKRLLRQGFDPETIAKQMGV